MDLLVLLYTILTIAWIGMAVFITMRVPKCTNMSSGWKVFIILLLAVHIVTQLHNMYTILQAHKISNSNAVSTRSSSVLTTTAAKQTSNVLMGSMWFLVILTVLMLVLYFMVFKNIYYCDDDLISKRTFWIFLALTLIQGMFSSSAMSSATHSLMIYSHAS